VPQKASGRVGRIVEVTFPDGHKLLGRGFTAAPVKPDESAKP
jgi:hypothetical protein